MAPDQKRAVAALEKALDLMNGNRPDDAADQFEQAWRLSNGNQDILKAACTGLADLGLRSRAFQLLDDNRKRYGESGKAHAILGMLASRMQQHDLAERAYTAAINAAPNEPDLYVNLVNAMVETGKAAQAIDILQKVLPHHPTYAKLWNSLGVLLRDHQNQGKKAKVFFDEAQRLAPNDPDILLNLSTYAEEDARINMLGKVVAASPANSVAHLNLALEYFEAGDFKRGWPHYRYRLDTNASGIRAAIYDVNAPLWKGEPLDGKTIMVLAEQGIGDEVLFAISFNRLIAQAGRVILTSDLRLVDIFNRSFDAHTIPFEEAIHDGHRVRSFPHLEPLLQSEGLTLDYVIHAGSLGEHLWDDGDNMPDIGGGILKPDPALVTRFENRFQGMLDRNQLHGSRFIGLSWRSGLLKGKRQFAYMEAGGLEAFSALTGTKHIALQYGADKDEIAEVRSASHLSMFNFPDIDLKDDIEANLAIIGLTDLVVGPATSTQMFSLLMGHPTWLISPGRPWWCPRNSSTSVAPFAPNVQLSLTHDKGSRKRLEDIVQDIATHLADKPLRHPAP